jgi:hypothetical protein
MSTHAEAIYTISSEQSLERTLAIAKAKIAKAIFAKTRIAEANQRRYVLLHFLHCL